MGRVELLLVGGSHLGSAGLPPTATFGVFVSRRMRRALGPTFAGTRSVFNEGLPEHIPALLPNPLPDGAVVFVLPRNLVLVPMLGELRHAASRVRRGRPLEFRSAFVPREGRAELLRRVRLAARGIAGSAYAIACLPLLPGRLARYGRQLDGVIEHLRASGAGLIVLATPIPLNDQEFPLARFYQRWYARLIRARRARRLEVIDLFQDLSAEPHGFLQPLDPLHLTAEGHRRVGALLWDAVSGGLGLRAPAAR